MEIDSLYDLNSHNIYFINYKKSDIKNLLFMDIINYFYEYDFHRKDAQSNNIRILVMDLTGYGKSTLINYLLGKKKAYCTLSLKAKIKGGEYNHSKYPILMKESYNSMKFDSQFTLKIIKDEVSNNFTIHIVFYLISHRGLDIFDINILIKFDEYHILYYLILTHENNEKGIVIASKFFRFLNDIIKNKEFKIIKTDLKEEKLIEYLERMKSKVKKVIFCLMLLKEIQKELIIF